MYLVIGLGVTGQSVLRYFKRKNKACLAYDVSDNFDFKDLQRQFPATIFSCGSLPVQWLPRFDKIILSPGIDIKSQCIQKLLKQGKTIQGDIELFSKEVKKPIIGITGSNAKSTVTSLVYEILAEDGMSVGVGGNIGTPALDLLGDSKKYDVYVLELSSFQLETTNGLKTISSSILNISEDHMDRYNDYQEYIKSKARILQHTDAIVLPSCLNSVVEVNANIKRINFAINCKVKQDREFNSDNKYCIIKKNNKSYLARDNQPIVAVDSMYLKAQHDQLNALSAMALTQAFDISSKTYVKVFSSFSGLEHRAEHVTQKDGILWINDSKATNVGATIAALKSFTIQAKKRKGKIILIAGGVGKNADFSPLMQEVQISCKQVLLFGKDAKEIYKALKGYKHLQQMDTLMQAVLAAKEIAVLGDIVLFSPSCASFDQFDNYIARGKEFKQMVLQ